MLVTALIVLGINCLAAFYYMWTAKTPSVCFYNSSGLSGWVGVGSVYTMSPFSSMDKSVNSPESRSGISPLLVFLVTIAVGIAYGVGFYRVGYNAGEHSVQAEAVKAGLAEWKSGFKFKGK